MRVSAGAAGLERSIGSTGRWATTGPIAAVGHTAIGRDIANLKVALASTRVTTGFVRVEAPPSVLPQRQNQYYKSEEEALFAIADALHEEYVAVVEAGPYVQIDPPSRQLLRRNGPLSAP